MSAAFLAGSMPISSLADAPKNQWVLNDAGEWNYYDSAGELVTGKEKMINKKWYAFDQDGRMYSDELFESPKDKFQGEYRYAYPDGHLADGWVKLTKDGGLYDGSDGEVWRFFGYSEGENSEEKAASMVKDREVKLKEDKFALDENGDMYSRSWAAVNEGKPAFEDQGPRDVMAYYQFDGFRAMNKSLYLDGSWYIFDEDGLVDRIIAIEGLEGDYAVTDVEVLEASPLGAGGGSVASPGNASPAEADIVKAPGRRIESIEIAAEDDVVEFVPGEEIVLKFNVSLVDETHEVKTKKFQKSHHDIWVSGGMTGKVKIAVTSNEDGSKNTCEVTYTPTNLDDGRTLELNIDEESGSAYELKKKKEDLSIKEKTTAVEAALDSAEELAPAVVMESISEVLEGAADAEKEALMEEVADHPNYAVLSDIYAMSKGISESVEVSESAQALWGDKLVQLVGGALNADAKDSVVLKVEKAEEEYVLSKQFGRQTTLEIALEVSGDAQSSLSYPVKITIPVPEGYAADSTLKLYHIHDGVEKEVKIKVEDGRISFITDGFSPFVLVQGETGEEDGENPGDDTGNTGTTGSTGNRGGRPVGSSAKPSPGQWILDETGWWYKNNDGTYPADTWALLSYDGKTSWYHFNKAGYMETGWFVDTDGKIYYLNPISNGQKGAMLTGWQSIDGIWYYFNTESNGYQGALYTNTVTPDGYTVNEQGQRIS